MSSSEAVEDVWLEPKQWAAMREQVGSHRMSMYGPCVEADGKRYLLKVPRKYRREIPQQRRQEIIAAMAPLQNNRCWWHGGEFVAGTSLRPTIEHLWPKCWHGSDEITNLVIACKACNNQRGADHWLPHPMIIGTKRYKLLGYCKRELEDALWGRKKTAKELALEASMADWNKYKIARGSHEQAKPRP